MAAHNAWSAPLPNDWREPDAQDKRVVTPASLSSLPPGSLHYLRADQNKHSSVDGMLRLSLRDGREIAVQRQHSAGKSAASHSWTGSILGADSRYQAVVTEGPDASFASLWTPAGRFELRAFGDAAWLIDLDHPLLSEPSSTHDFVLDSEPPAAGAARTSPVEVPAQHGKASTAIDVLFLYTQGFADRYPGSVAQTRIEHLVAVANQGLANSRVDLAVRLVGAEQVAYNDSNDNSEALTDLRDSMTPGASIIGLEGISQLRSARGADLVTLIRPHDIEVRGSCGIAFLFNNMSQRGVNVVSDGNSGWSACSTATYLHEVGHNLGAEHQNGANSSEAGFGTAYIALDRFHTLMGSFGSGDPNRFLRLLTFSNPQIRCGGEPCGVAGASDNARRIRDNLAAVAAYRSAVSAEPIANLAALDLDSDGDGVNDSEDAFPFDARWRIDSDRDGVADNEDAFPSNPAESRDLDGDGIGDNQDDDRDGDGVANSVDALPDDLRDSLDGDRDGIGDSQDAFPADRNEWGDADSDGVGDITDSDADGDGVDDLDTAAMDLLVVSSGNDRILRLEGDSGLFANIEVIGDYQPSAFGEYGRLQWDAPRKSLLALADAGVVRYTRAPVSRSKQLLFGSSRAGTPTLTGAFPAGIARDDQGRVFVTVTTSRDLSRYDAINGELLAGGGLNQVDLFSAPTRDLARTADGKLWMLLRDGTVIEVDAETGALGLELPGSFLFIAPDSVDISAMIAGPDGALWFADRAGSRIWRLVPGSVVQASVVVAAGTGGLRQPGGLAFGPDGRLYVSSTGSNQILRFDPVTGQLIDVFSKVAPGSLLQPRALTFAPRVRDRYPLDAQRQVRPVLGGWWNPARSGHGLEVARVGDVLAITWYTYTQDGKPTWYQAAAPFSGSEWQGELRRYRWNGSVASSEAVGSARLSFASDRSATFSWTLPSSNGSEPMQPLTVGTTSESQAPTAAWYPPAESGWGVSFGRQSEVAFGLVFFYDSAGEPTWGLAAGGFDPQAMQFDLLQTFGPTRCPGCSGSDNPSNQSVGSLRFDLGGSSNQATVTISATAPGIDWQRSAAQFVPLTDTPTDPQGRPRAFDGH